MDTSTNSKIFRVWYDGGGMVEITAAHEHEAIEIAHTLTRAVVSHATDITMYLGEGRS